jgi:hypothetical protein
MADESDDDDERLASLQRRAENFREFLNEGDEVSVGIYDGEMYVQDSYRSTFERQHPKLLGRMLAIEAQMETGLFPYFAALLATGAVIAGLHLRWWDGLIGETVSDYLQNWWFYVGLPVALLFLTRSGCGQYQKFVYRRNRPELAELIAAERLDRDVLLVMLRDSGEVDNVLYQLSLDRRPFPETKN